MATMNAIETAGYKFRELGIKNKIPSLGYSVHVQTATYARIGSMIALPIMAWLIDNEKNIETIILIPIISSSLFIALAYISNNSKKAEILINAVFEKLTRKYKSKINENSKTNSNKDIESKDLKKISRYAYFSYLFIISGTYASFIVASLTPKYRATIIQLSPLITSIGTFISVTYFDPKVSYLNETSREIHNITTVIFNGRIYASGTLLLITTMLYIYI